MGWGLSHNQSDSVVAYASNDSWEVEFASCCVQADNKHQNVIL